MSEKNLPPADRAGNLYARDVQIWQLPGHQELSLWEGGARRSKALIYRVSRRKRGHIVRVASICIARAKTWAGLREAIDTDRLGALAVSTAGSWAYIDDADRRSVLVALQTLIEAERRVPA